MSHISNTAGTPRDWIELQMTCGCGGQLVNNNDTFGSILYCDDCDTHFTFDLQTEPLSESEVTQEREKYISFEEEKMKTLQGQL